MPSVAIQARESVQDTPEDVELAVGILDAASKAITSYDVTVDVTYTWRTSSEMAGVRTDVPPGRKPIPVTKARKLRPGEEAAIQKNRTRQVYSDNNRRVEVLPESSDDAVAVLVANLTERRQLSRIDGSGIISAPPTEFDNALCGAYGDYLTYFRTIGVYDLCTFVFRARQGVRLRPELGKNGELVLEAAPDADPDAMVLKHDWGFRVWLDPKHGHLPNRIEAYQIVGEAGTEKEFPTQSIAVDEFFEFHDSLWAPIRITATEYIFKGELIGDPNLEVTALVDTARSRWNIPIPAESFSLEFPSGTQVADLLRKVSYVVGDRNIEKNLERIAVDAADEVGQAQERPSGVTLTAVLSAATFVVLAVLIGLWLLRPVFKR